MTFYEVRWSYGEAATIEADSYTVDATNGSLRLIKDGAEVAWWRYPDGIWPVPDPAS